MTSPHYHQIYTFYFWCQGVIIITIMINVTILIELTACGSTDLRIWYIGTSWLQIMFQLPTTGMDLRKRSVGNSDAFNLSDLCNFKLEYYKFLSTTKKIFCLIVLKRYCMNLDTLCLLMPCLYFFLVPWLSIMLDRYGYG